jgi:hypothetical protein
LRLLASRFPRDYENHDYICRKRKSGEEFRDDVLLPALKKSDEVIVDLNGVLTLGSSFLEEAFGGLVRKGYYTAKELKSKLVIKFQLDSYVAEAWDYVKSARKE